MRYNERVIKHDPKHWAAKLIHWVEVALAVIVAIAIGAAFVQSIGVLTDMDWTEIATIYEMLDRLLIIVIGLEFVRILVVRKLVSVLELLAFVVARKMLKPDLPALDIALGAFAFIMLIGARYAIEYYHRKTGVKNPPIPQNADS